MVQDHRVVLPMSLLTLLVMVVGGSMLIPVLTSMSPIFPMNWLTAFTLLDTAAPLADHSWMSLVRACGSYKVQLVTVRNFTLS
jgi:hypothetical protein